MIGKKIIKIFMILLTGVAFFGITFGLSCDFSKNRMSLEERFLDSNHISHIRYSNVIILENSENNRVKTFLDTPFTDYKKYDVSYTIEILENFRGESNSGEFKYDNVSHPGISNNKELIVFGKTFRSGECGSNGIAVEDETLEKLRELKSKSVLRIKVGMFLTKIKSWFGY